MPPQPTPGTPTPTPPGTPPVATPQVVTPPVVTPPVVTPPVGTPPVIRPPVIAPPVVTPPVVTPPVITPPVVTPPVVTPPTTVTWAASPTNVSLTTKSPTVLATVPNISGQVTFSLMVTDKFGSSQPSTVTITIQPPAPQAKITTPQPTVPAGSQISLSGAASTSSHPDGIQNFTFTLVPPP